MGITDRVEYLRCGLGSEKARYPLSKHTAAQFTRVEVDLKGASKANYAYALTFTACRSCFRPFRRHVGFGEAVSLLYAPGQLSDIPRTGFRAAV